MSKLRSDSVFCQLTTEQVETLDGWLFEERLGYKEITEKLKGEFGLETSMSGVRRFYQRLAMERSRESLMEAISMSAEAREAVKGGVLQGGLLAFANKCALELLMQPQPAVREFTALFRAITSAQALEMKRTEFERDENHRREIEARESWRMTPRDLEEEKEELRQQRAARRKAKLEAAEAAKRKENESAVDKASDEMRGRDCPAGCRTEQAGSLFHPEEGADAEKSGDGDGAWEPKVLDEGEREDAEECGRERALKPLSAA